MVPTDWFPGDSKPTRKGLYQRMEGDRGPFWSIWNGKFWGFASCDKDVAICNQRIRSTRQNDPWRGVQK